MGHLSEGRVSDSPYIEMIWRGRAGSEYAPTCPADSRWNLLLLRQDAKVRVSVEGPLTKAKPKTQAEGRWGGDPASRSEELLLASWLCVAIS